MMPSTIDPDMPVDEIMRRWPATIRTMIRHRMLCVGCPIGIFHTVAEAAAAHAINEVALSGELLAAMRSDPRLASSSAFEARDLKSDGGDASGA